MALDPELLKQLIETFKAELEEQTQIMTQGLLKLEKGISNQEEWQKTIDSIFRSAHNIKGASRGLGINQVGEIAHRIETLFSHVQKKSLAINPQLIDICLEAIDKMQISMTDFLEKKPASNEIDDFLVKLDKQIEVPKTGEISPSPKEEKEEVVPAKKAAQETEVIEDKNISDKRVAESIRIPVHKIEKVSALMEEIQVNKIGIDDHYDSLKQLGTNISRFYEALRHHSPYLKREINDMQQKLHLNISDQITEIKNSIEQINKNLYFRVNELSSLSGQLQDEIHTLRLIPVENFLCTMPRYVRDLSHELNKEAELSVKGNDVKIDKMVLERLKDPLIHLVRNSIDHGLEPPEQRLANHKPAVGRISIMIKEESNHIVISISDDGKGIDIHKVKKLAVDKKLISQDEVNTMTEQEILELIFMPGFSTKEIITSISGRGVGLDVVRENINQLNGSINIKTEQHKGTTFELKVPLTLASEKGLIVGAANQAFVIPINYIHRAITVSAKDIHDVEGIQAILMDNRTIPLHTLIDILGLEQEHLPSQDQLFIIILKKGSSAIALLVDEIIGEREIVLKPFQKPLASMNCIAGGTLSGNNRVIIALNPSDIIDHAMHLGKIRRIDLQDEIEKQIEKTRILVVDDSITTRTLEKNILESKNYSVTVAVNGKEAWDLLQKEKFELMITDVNMPIMDGFTLTSLVKQADKLRSMPVIIVTSLDSEAEKKRGVEAGADAYIVKSEFESGKLLDIVDQLV